MLQILVYSNFLLQVRHVIRIVRRFLDDLHRVDLAVYFILHKHDLTESALA